MPVGECVRLYRVDKILHSANKKYQFYLNKEITLSFLNKKLENQFHKFVCGNNKYKYIFSDKFRSNLFGVGRLDVTDRQLLCGD